MAQICKIIIDADEPAMSCKCCLFDDECKCGCDTCKNASHFEEKVDKYGIAHDDYYWLRFYGLMNKNGIYYQNRLMFTMNQISPFKKKEGWYYFYITEFDKDEVDSSIHNVLEKSKFNIGRDFTLTNAHVHIKYSGELN